MKSRLKWQRLSSARMICGRRRWQSSTEQQRWQMRKIAELEARSYLLEAVLQAALHRTGSNYKISPESAPPTLH